MNRMQQLEHICKKQEEKLIELMRCGADMRKEGDPE